MVVLGNIVRVLDMILIVSYFPVLYFRFNKSDQQHRVYLIGVMLVLFGILAGSALRFGQPFTGPSAIVLVGVGCIWVESIINIRNDRRTK